MTKSIVNTETSNIVTYFNIKYDTLCITVLLYFYMTGSTGLSTPA